MLVDYQEVPLSRSRQFLREIVLASLLARPEVRKSLALPEVREISAVHDVGVDGSFGLDDEAYVLIVDLRVEGDREVLIRS